MSKVSRYIFISLGCVVVAVIAFFAIVDYLWRDAMQKGRREILPREQRYIDSLQTACSCTVTYIRRAFFVPQDSMIVMVMGFYTDTDMAQRVPLDSNATDRPQSLVPLRLHMGQRVALDSNATAQYMVAVVKSLWNAVEHRDLYAGVSLELFRTDSSQRLGKAYAIWEKRENSMDISFRHWQDPQLPRYHRPASIGY